MPDPKPKNEAKPGGNDFRAKKETRGDDGKIYHNGSRIPRQSLDEKRVTVLKKSRHIVDWTDEEKSEPKAK